MTNLGWDLRKSLRINDSRVFYGISCPCCDSANYLFYSQQIQNPNITFANLFVNSNYQRFKRDFLQLERDAVLITNIAGNGKPYGKLRIQKRILLADDAVSLWEKSGQQFLQQILDIARNFRDTLFCISAGPLSEVIIASLFRQNPDNCYIDFGSAIDFITHDKTTRAYQLEQTPYAHQKCWMFDSKDFCTDVDVVLTSYKRPYALKSQLDAIENQTLKSRNIFLFQDGIDDCYQINFDPKFLARFYDVEISKKNCGVWKRFEYASKIAKSKYVCIFDDDTIPGNRWLENCLMNSMQHRGVYGTNGILLKTVEGYPENVTNRLNIGWHNPNSKTTEVDFVGHAWFIEREFLDWMLTKKFYAERYRTSGEDMAISFACQEHGISTFVPQHPKEIRTLWGSIPEFGFKFGNDQSALSLNPNEWWKMKFSITEMHSDGWKFLYEIAEKT